MARTMSEVTVNTAKMTDKCLLEMAAGALTTGATYKLVLLNLAGAGTGADITQASAVFLSDISNMETTNTSGATYTAGGLALGTTTGATVAAHVWSLDWADISLNDANFTTDAYAIIRSTGVAGTSPVLAIGKWDATKAPSGTGTGNFVVTITSPIKFTAS